MLIDPYTVALFGHRYINDPIELEARLEDIIGDLIKSKSYIEFLIGRNGDFDRCASSAISRMKKKYDYSNAFHVLVLPYPTAEYLNNEKYFEDYYDEIEICQASVSAHFKASIGVRNRQMVDRADLIICYIDRKSGGAFQALKYAESQNKTIINIFSCKKEITL